MKDPKLVARAPTPPLPLAPAAASPRVSTASVAPESPPVSRLLIAPVKCFTHSVSPNFDASALVIVHARSPAPVMLLIFITVMASKIPARIFPESPSSPFQSPDNAPPIPSMIARPTSFKSLNQGSRAIKVPIPSPRS